jgi:hypothetical protein
MGIKELDFVEAKPIEPGDVQEGLSGFHPVRLYEADHGAPCVGSLPLVRKLIGKGASLGGRNPEKPHPKQGAGDHAK